jgi:hypothetical protein
MWAGGIVAVAGGLAAVITGAWLVSSSANRIPIYDDTPSFPQAYKDDALRRDGGAWLMAGGAIAGAAGIPLWIVGSKLVPISRDDKAPRPAFVPELRVGVSGASLSLRF